MASIDRLGGWVGERAERNISGWLAAAPFSSGALFAAYRHRDLPSEIYDSWFPDKCPFAAEFPGKLLVSVCECLRLHPGDQRLMAAGRYLTDKLKQIGTQDGYLGLFSMTERYVGHEGRREWDVWGAYHVMWGLLLWKDLAQDQAAEELLLACADAMCRHFLADGKDLLEAQELFANLSAGRIFALLFERYDNQAYWQMATLFLDALKRAGFDLLGQACAKESFHHTVVGKAIGRWELLHTIVMLGDLARITGEKRYDEALAFYWQDIFEHDVHNTGGYSSAEGSVGDPFSLGAVELCCSIMWADLTAAFWHRTHQPHLADELERTFYNALLGSQHPTGRWWTYSSPMCGRKKPVEDIVVYQGFHFDGCHEINCCAANSGRGIGQLSNWAAAEADGRLYVNYYGECRINAAFHGEQVQITQQTAYPRDGKVVMEIETAQPVHFALMLRIPHWARGSSALVNGEALSCKAGEYLAIERLWKAGDRIELGLEMTTHFLKADERLDELTSIYYGPLLLAFDYGKNPDFDWKRLRIEYSEDAQERRFYQPSMRSLKVTLDGVIFRSGSFALLPARQEEAYPEPVVHFLATTEEEESIHLIDYATAGMDNEWFTTWFAFNENTVDTNEGE